MTLRRLLIMSALGLASACDAGPGAANEDEKTLAVDCGGKCDGLDSVRDMLRDPSELDLDDLIDNGKDLITEELNEVLASGDLGGFAVEFHNADQLDPLVRDMAAAYGERELTTAVNLLRLQHLETSPDTVYAETSLTLEPGTGASWGRSVAGLTEDGDSTVRLGFTADAEITAHVISAHDAETDNPITRLQSLREFAVPRSIADLQAMKPGEAVALHGEGNLGINLGVGVPLLIAEPTTVLTYNVVLTAGLRTRLGGILDVQLLRMGGNDIVVDVGIQKVNEKSAFLAVSDRWGVQGLIESSIDIAGIEVNLGTLVDRALQKQLNERLSLIAAVAKASKVESRMTVARMRFDLTANPEVLEPALAQALRGDIRLAQALSNRGEPGVLAELDLLRSGASCASEAGIELFGMSFFRRKVEDRGTIVVQAPGGVRTIMFESLRKEWDWLLSRHGYTRVGLSGLLFDPRDPNGDVESEVNLVVQLLEGDKAMERDKLIDHLDGLMIALAGRKAVTALEGPGNEMQRWIQAECRGSAAFDDCPIDSISDPQIDMWTQQGLTALDSEISGLPAETAAFVRSLGELRMLAQGTFEIGASFTGPSTTIVTDYRFDDQALETLALTRNAGNFKTALTDYLEVVEIDRGDEPTEIADARAEIAADIAMDAENAGKIFEDYGNRYRRLLESESAAIESVGLIGADTMEVRFTVDANNRPVYEEAIARSLPETRADVMREMFDTLVEEADDWSPHAEQSVGYVLLSMLPVEQSEVGFELDMGLEDTFNFWREPYRQAGYPESLSLFVQGSEVAPIDGGLFDVEGIPVVSED